MEERLMTIEEAEHLAKLKSGKIETDEDLVALADVFDEDSEIETEDNEPQPEQSLEFLTGGERYIKD